MLLLLVLMGCADRTHVHQLGDIEVITVRRSYNNAHVVRSGVGTVLVDAGLERDAEDLDADLRAAGVRPGDLDWIVVTHGHADHAGGAGWFRETYGIPIAAGEGDRTLLSDGKNDRLCPTDGTAERRLDDAQSEQFEPIEADFWVAPDTSADLVIGNQVFGTLTSVPGHTEGSLVLHLGRIGVIGDLIRGSVTGSAARTHYYMCDLDDNRRDMQVLVDHLAPRADTFFVGHFGPLDRSAIEKWLRTETSSSDSTR